MQTTWVTSTNNFKTLLVHVHNFDSNSHTINDIIVDGKSTSTTGSIGAGEHRLFQFTTAKAEGDVWTVNLDMAGGPLVGNGGRLGKELFPMEVWQHSS